MVYDNNFEIERKKYFDEMVKDESISKLKNKLFSKLVENKYSYQFDWLGVPIIQMPSDLMVFQELIFLTKPDVIVETGVARGGSLIFWASMLDLLKNDGHVIGIDIKIHEHTKLAIKESKLNHKIHLIENDSISPLNLEFIRKIEKKTSKYLVFLDSNHTEDHVFQELELYKNLLTSNSYIVVLDTIIEFLPKESNRDWGPGNSPMSAINKFMEKYGDTFGIDNYYSNKSLLTVAPSGFIYKL